MKCFLCEKEYDSEPVFDLGEVYPSVFINNLAEEIKFKKADLALVQCDCGFVQLRDVLPPDSMYREYWYRSGLNSSMVKSLLDVVQGAMKRADLRYRRVMDIGCNDGTLLSFYGGDFFRVGYDPANNLANYAIENCNVFVNDYFNGNISYSEPFDIITSIAMFYDLEKPRDFIASIKKYLAPKGVWVVQMTDLTSMLKVNAFDNVCHEHLSYYTFKQLHQLMKDEGMQVFDVEYNDVNGGSVRAYICHEDARPVNIRVYEALTEEEQVLNDRDWDEFNRITDAIINKSGSFIKAEAFLGKLIYGLGASTKGNTYLQAAGLTSHEIPYILEVSKDKFGKYTLGSDCKILSQKDLCLVPSDYLLILPWHFTDFFLKQDWILDYMNKGGKLIVPMPEPGIWSMSNGILSFKSLDPSVKVWNEK